MGIQLNNLVFPHKFNNETTAMTTSLFLAEYFEKEHKNVLRAIENLDCSAKFSQLNFEPSKYKDERGKYQPIYRMTRSGFTFIAMGFTGKKAAQFKEAYIYRFDEMESWIKSREALKDDQVILTNAIQYRERITGKKDKFAYCRENNLIYRVALGTDKKAWLKLNGYPKDDTIRQHLTQQQISLIDQLVIENAVMIKLNMTYEQRQIKLKESALHYLRKQQTDVKGES